MKCNRCGAKLRSPASIARGMSLDCAKQIEHATTLEDEVLDPPGSRLLFPETDRPLVEAAKKEVQIANGKPKRGVAAVLGND
jgi:hypothetical protein